MHVQHKQVVKLKDGSKGLYVTFGEPDQDRTEAVTIRMRYREAEAAALQRLLAEVQRQ